MISLICALLSLRGGRRRRTTWQSRLMTCIPQIIPSQKPYQIVRQALGANRNRICRMEKHKEEDLYLPVYSKTTNDIRVSVCPQFVEDESDISSGVFAFAYTVTIENCGSNAVQLLNRHWVINSGGALYSEVKGEGVVGKQPVLDPGHGVQYTSWSVIKDPIGSMAGSYLFKGDGEDMFEVSIPKFDLVHTLQVH